MSFHCGREIIKCVARLLAAGFHYGQNGGDEAATVRALRSERQLPPDHGVPQRLFGSVVGRLHALDIHEGPKVLVVLHQLLAEIVRVRVIVTAQQERAHALADWLHAAAKPAAQNRPVAHFLPKGEQFLGRLQQIAAKAFLGGATVVEECLEIAFQVCPAPLQSAKTPVHPGPVAVNDAGEHVAEQLLKHLGGPAGATGEKSEGRGNKGPDPRFDLAFLGR